MGKVKSLNLAGIRAAKSTPEATAFLRAKAEAIAAAARSSAPVESGDYRDSITVTMDVHPRAGAVAHIGAHVPYAMKVEASTGNLARSLDA